MKSVDSLGSPEAQQPASTRSAGEASGTARGRLQVRMEDVARTAKVSRATVSRVLVGHPPVAESTREKVLNAVERLGYVPNLLAQQLSGSSSDLVGLLLRDPRNPAYGMLHSSIQEAASRQGVELITAVPHWQEGTEDELAALRRLLGLRVGGLLVSTGVIRANDLAPFLDNVPIVSVGRVEDHPGIYGVSYDEAGHGRLLADAVFGKGHRSVAVLVPSVDVSTAENLRGMSIAARLEELGATVHRIDTEEFGQPSSGITDMLKLVDAGAVTAAMFPNDTRAVLFLQAARTANLMVPGDVSVTGCDGTMPGLDLIGLCTVRIPVEAVAARGMEVLRQLMRGPGTPDIRHEKFAGVLVPGPTLGKVGS